VSCGFVKNVEKMLFNLVFGEMIIGVKCIKVGKKPVNKYNWKKSREY